MATEWTIKYSSAIHQSRKLNKHPYEDKAGKMPNDLDPWCNIKIQCKNNKNMLGVHIFRDVSVHGYVNIASKKVF